MKNEKECAGYDWEHIYQVREEFDRALNRFQSRAEALRGLILLLLIWAILVGLGCMIPVLGALLSGGPQWLPW